MKLQGGPMSSAECRRFEQRRHAMDAVMLRRCDDAAHDPVHAVPSLMTWLPVMRSVAAATSRLASAS
ncbi:MAG: hypothetical protein R2715_17980 [Ilumatobacteraceae bacterium]